MTSLSAQTLSQNDFLKLLVAQMTSQDPLSPLNNQDLLTQMVQFSTLQQNTNMQSTLSQVQATEGITQANALLGRQVTIQVDDNTTTQGVISGVQLNSGAPQIMVNGTLYDVSQVLSIATAPATTP